ncbi:hypothetical protein N665_0019s0044 [Sinapis alba]|nr:hypothetical protein N665_0019s0044 [Sinapis alba]
MDVYGLEIGGLVKAISSSLSRTTALPVSGLFLVLSVLLVASRFETPFFLDAHGNKGLSPLIPFPWAINATLTPVCL